MGVFKLAERINDPSTPQWYDGIFPKDTQVGLEKEMEQGRVLVGRSGTERRAQ